MVTALSLMTELHTILELIKSYVKHQPRCTLRGRPRIHYNSLGTGSTPYEPFWVDRVDPVLRWHIILRVRSSRARHTAWSRYFNVTSIIVTIILREPPSLSDWKALRWLTWFRLKMIDWRTWLEIWYDCCVLLVLVPLLWSLPSMAWTYTAQSW